jgi:hypothetical protein
LVTTEGQETPKVPETVNQTQETKPETPTAELETLRQKLTELQNQSIEAQKKLEQTEKGLRTAHATLTEKDRQLKEQTDLRKIVAGLDEKIEMAFGYIAEKDSEMELSPEKKQDLKKQFQQVKVKQQQEELANKVKEYQERTEALKLDPNSEEYLDIKDFAILGKFDRAEAKLKKLEESKKLTTETPKPEVKKEEPKETIEQIKARLKDEIRKEILIERGELNAETGQPSGGTMTESKARELYAQGKLSESEARKRGVTFS